MKPTLAIAAATALIGLAAPGSAQAIGFAPAPPLASAPVNTQAGANSNYNIHVEFTTPGDDVRNLTIGLPPGQIGDPTGSPVCTVAQLNADSCPPASAVGSVVTNLLAYVIVIPVPLSAPGDLYNLEAQPGEPPSEPGKIWTPGS